jgi:uncharacterized lipoprotein
MPYARIAFAFALILSLSGCASWMPDDPYLKAQETKTLQIPEGLDTPSTDSTLTTTIGAGKVVDGGHRPPSAAAPTPAAAPSVEAKPDVAPQTAPENSPEPKKD